MEFVIPGQMRGPECKPVIKEAIAIRRTLEGWFSRLPTKAVRKLTVVLRVDGSLGSFGPAGVENIRLEKNEIECDLVLPDHGWESLSATKLSSIVRSQVAMAIHQCLAQFDVSHDPEELRKELNKT